MSILRNSILTITGRVTAFVLFAANGIVVARLLGPTARGEYALLILTANFSAILLTFGLGTSSAYFISQKKIAASTLLSFALCFGVLLGTLAVLVFWRLDETIIATWFPGVSNAHLRLCAFAIPGILLCNFLLGITQGLERFVLYNLTNALRPLAALLCFLTLWYIGMRDVQPALWAYILGFTLASAVLFIALASSRNDEMFLNSQKLKLLFGYGWKVYLAEISSYLFYRVDLFLIGYFLDTTQAGYYALAAFFAEGMWLLAGSIGTVLLPAAGSRNAEQMRTLVPRAVRMIVLLTGLSLFALFLFDEAVITVVVGEDYLPALAPLRYSYLGILAMSLIKVIAAYALSLDQAQFNTRVTLVGLCSNFLLNLWLIPKLGIVGAALATSSSYVLMAFCYLVWLRRRTQTPLFAMLRPRVEDWKFLNAR